MATSTSMTLSQLMSAVRQRADMFPSGYSPSLNSTAYFVTDPELISYINQSYFELYDLLVTTFEDYYVGVPIIFTTNGSQFLYPLPDGVITFTNAITGATGFVAPPCLKVKGIDLGLSNGNNAWMTIERFEFIERNKYIFPQLTSTYLGVFNLRYKIEGDNIYFIPTPAGNQQVRLWYIPRLTQLAALADQADGISGWTEYIITDAAIKCMQKEESDVSVLLTQKAALIKRINDSAANRDVGQPSKISDTRNRAQNGFGGPGFNGTFGGY